MAKRATLPVLLERRQGRSPPMPAWPGSGRCKWCTEPILWGPGHATKAGQPNTRRSWHPACVGLYRTAAFSAEQRQAIRRRGDLVCVACRLPCYVAVVDHRGKAARQFVREWEADHRRPLWSLPALMTMAERARWFGLDNLQMLCVPCHAAKSAREAGFRRLGVYGIALMLETPDAPRDPAA